MQTPASEFRSRRSLNQSLVAQEVADCEEDILSLQKALIDLKYKRMSLNTKANSVHDLMEVLPLDVITEIFQIIIDNQDPTDFSLPVPFLLGRICTAWRNISWKIPLLWRNVRIQLSSKQYSKQESLLQEWPDRSGTCPLSFSIACRDTWQPPQSFATMILKTSERWATFKCTSGLSSFSGVGILSAHSFSLLSTLDLGFRGCKADYRFRGLPQLRHLHMDISGSLQANIAVPWNQLTTLSIKQLTHMAFIANIIDKLRNSIESLYIEHSRDELDQSDSEVIVPKTLSRLTSLVYLGPAAIGSDLFKRITAPALSNLKIGFDKPMLGNDSWMIELERLRDRSAFKLTTLSIGRTFIQEESLLDLLHPFNTLSLISIETQGFALSDNTISRLCPKADDNAEFFLPALERFQFKGKISFTPSIVLTMLDQRAEVSQTDSSMKTLRATDITYTNAQWAQTGENKNPNRVQAFHRSISDLASRGIIVNIEWDENQNTME